MTEPSKPKIVDRVLNWIDENSKLVANLLTSWLVNIPPVLRKVLALVVNKLIDYGVVKIEALIDMKRDKKAIEKILAANASNAPLNPDDLDAAEREILEGKRD